MAFHQVKDIIAESCNVHRKVAEYYDEMQDFVEDEKAQMLLSNMQEHEEQIVHCMKSYLADKSSTLDTWFQYIPELPSAQEIIKVDLDETTTDQDVLQVFDKVSERFGVRYSKLSSISPSEAVKDLFADMAKMEKNESMRESWIKTMMDDM
ncbi:MAG: hypothetical protein NE334_07980 [Lentisphaeraceae bacterium]|nr:hypothetical protein [Lentisphaeraceae bacterium]